MDMENVMTKGIEMYDSLIDSVHKAGGTARSFKLEKLKEMTVIELISMLATNNIRFIHVSEKEEDYIRPEFHGLEIFGFPGVKDEQ